MYHIGQQIRQIMKAKKIKQAKLAELSGLPLYTINNIVTGKNKKSAHIQKIFAALEKIGHTPYKAKIFADFEIYRNIINLFQEILKKKNYQILNTNFLSLLKKVYDFTIHNNPLEQEIAFYIEGCIDVSLAHNHDYDKNDNNTNNDNQGTDSSTQQNPSLNKIPERNLEQSLEKNYNKAAQNNEEIKNRYHTHKSNKNNFINYDNKYNFNNKNIDDINFDNLNADYYSIFSTLNTNNYSKSAANDNQVSNSNHKNKVMHNNLTQKYLDNKQVKEKDVEQQKEQKQEQQKVKTEDRIWKKWKKYYFKS